MNPNKDQSKGISVFKKWDWKANPIFVLAGLSGSGKTACAELLLRNSKGSIPKSTVLGVAVSNLAKINLSKRLPTCTTFARVTGLSLDFSDDDENPMAVGFVEKKDFRRDSSLDKVKTLVVDEASMLTRANIMKAASNMPNLTKIIALCDKYQLPVIGADGDEDSDVFDNIAYELTEPVRQNKDDYIFEFATKIKKMIDNKDSISKLRFVLGTFNTKMKDGKGYAFRSREKNLSSLAKSIKDGENSIAVTFRHKSRIKINHDVRKLIQGETKHKYDVGDVIMSRQQYQPNLFWQHKKNGGMILLPKGDYIMNNGDRFSVLDVKQTLLKKSYLLNMFKASDYLNRNFNDISRLKNIYHDILGSGIWCWQLVLDGASQPINVLHEDGKQQYSEAKKQLMELSYIHGNISIAMQFLNKFADIDYGYCSTIYSIQGSTLDKTYVDLSDVMDCSKLSNKRKLQSLYTAATRPKYNLGIF